MKIQRVAKESSMVIVIENLPEIRFTPGGKRLATFYAWNMSRIAFQQWDEDEPQGHLSPYQRETGEYDGTVDKLLELPPNAEIEIHGHSEIRRFKLPNGEQSVSNLFIIRSWTYAKWREEWKR